MSTIVVRYQPRPDRADENQRLVEDVFAELNTTQPEGIRYATWRLADGTFVHIADVTADTNPLSVSAAFQRFQEGVGERCEPDHGPDARPATLVGNYHLLPNQP